MDFEQQGDHTNVERSEADQVMQQIESGGISQTTRMMANLNVLREQGLEAGLEVREALELIRAQIDGYLEK